MAIIVFHTHLPTLSLISEPNSESKGKATQYLII